jgi:hypothetical protein
MPESTILAAKVSVLDRFFRASQFSMPAAYRAVLGHPERIPEVADVFTEPSRIIAFNLRLRANGWFTSPGWPDSFLAIGEDPGGNVVYFDANSRGDAVWLANHEVSTTASDPSECMDMEKQADSFSAYVTQTWQHYLDDEGELPIEASDRSEEFKILREHPHPLLLENYFEESAARYEAYESWKRRRGDYHLFFAAINLEPESAHKLLAPAADIAARQQTYGRFRAAVGLLERLLSASEQIALPAEASSAAAEILKRVETFNLDDYDAWDAVKEALRRA